MNWFLRLLGLLKSKESAKAEPEKRSHPTLGNVIDNLCQEHFHKRLRKLVDMTNEEVQAEIDQLFGITASWADRIIGPFALTEAKIILMARFPEADRVSTWLHADSAGAEGRGQIHMGDRSVRVEW